MTVVTEAAPQTPAPPKPEHLPNLSGNEIERRLSANPFGRQILAQLEREMKEADDARMALSTKLATLKQQLRDTEQQHEEAGRRFANAEYRKSQWYTFVVRSPWDGKVELR